MSPSSNISNPVLADTVAVHPDLACHALRTGCCNEYAVYLIMMAISPHDHGVDTSDIVRLSKHMRFRQKSTIYRILERGKRVWWDVDSRGLWVRRGCGRQALYARFELSVRDTPKRVPLADLRSPKAVCLACIHPSERWNRQSRATITARTGVSRDSQLRAEKCVSPEKHAVHADLDCAQPTPEYCDQWGGVWPNPTTGRFSKQLPNEYRSPYPDAPYGRVSRASRKRPRFRRVWGQGRKAGRREPQKRYFDSIKSGARAIPPIGLRSDEVTGPVFSQSRGVPVCRQMPVFKNPGRDGGWVLMRPIDQKVDNLQACVAYLSAWMDG